MIIKSEDFKKILINISDAIEKNVNYLTELDAEIGDGDHGANMNKGFKKIRQMLKDTETIDAGEMLILAGKVLLNEIGGAMGPLYGGGLVKAGISLKGKTELDKNDIYLLFSSMLESVKSLGGAKTGDKTMVDTLEPFVESYGKKVSQSDIKEAFGAALDEAKKGMLSTKDMISRVGRSSRLLERSRGHIDVGAASSYIILESFYNSIAVVNS